MIRWIFKWLFRFVFAAIALVVIVAVIFLLTYNSILRLAIERNIREQTGMDAEIGRFHLSLTEPTVEIQNLKIYNPPDFGGAPFLNIPEIHVEYDRAALMKRKIHVTLLRLNLAEMDIVKNQNGETNIFVFAGISPQKSGAATAQRELPANGSPALKPSPSQNQPPAIVPPSLASLENQTGFDFEKKIDVVNISVGKLKYIDLENPRDDRTQTVGIENCVIPNVKSPADLAGLAALIYLRSGGFFDSLAGKNSQPGNPAVVQDILRLAGVAF